MSLAHRIIPTILCHGRELVKGVGFQNARRVGVAAQAVRIHALRGVDEVVLLDISATREERGPDLALRRLRSGQRGELRERVHHRRDLVHHGHVEREHP